MDSRNMKWLIPHQITTTSKELTPPLQSGRKLVVSSSQSDIESSSRAEVAEHSDGDRLWSYLLSNINRSIDELYRLCEEEKSVDRCQEAMGILSQYQVDFQNLISNFLEQERFSKAMSPQQARIQSPVLETTLPQAPLAKSKLNATAPPFHPKGFQQPIVACNPPQKEESTIPSPLSLKIETSELASQEPHGATQSNGQELKVPLIHSEREESGDEQNDPSSDEREALEVAMESELVWAQTEAWVEAEIIAEEEAWNHLLLPLSSDLDTDFDETDSIKDNRHENERNLCEEVIISGKPSSSLICDISDDPDMNPPFVDLPPRVGLSVVPQSPTSPSFLLPLKSPLTSSQRRLHDKLSSPDRSGLRNHLTPEQIKMRQEIKQSIAESNRDKTAMVASNRVKASEMKEAQRIALAEQLYRQKLEEAEKRHSEYIKSIRGRAGNENTKVSEVLFINSLNEDALAAELQRTLEDVENRILAGRKRREEHLTGISDQQRRRNRKKVEQMSELRLALEKEKMERWEKIQTRLETVRARREERLAELQRRTLEARERASISTEPNTIEAEKEDLERRILKKDSRKEKQKKPQYVDEYSLLDTQKKSAETSSICGPLKNPLQIDDDTIDSILQRLKTLNAPIQHSVILSLNESESSPLQSTLRNISNLISRNITPSLLFDCSRLSDILGTSVKSNKRKKKINDSVQLPSDGQLLQSSESDNSSKVDITDALCALSQSIGEIPFPMFNYFLHYCMNKEFGCLSNVRLLLTLTQTPLSFTHSKMKIPQERIFQSIFEKLLSLVILQFQRQTSDQSDRLHESSGNMENINSILHSNLAQTLADVCHFCLIIIEKWGEKAFPLVLHHHQKLIAKPNGAQPQNKIFWPPFILSVIPNLFSIILKITEVLIMECNSSFRDMAISWVRYVCTCGLIDQISIVLRELQCVADFSEKDDFLSYMLCKLSLFMQKYIKLVGCLNCSSLSNVVIETFRNSDISWNLISLLGVLLLQDGAHSHSYRRQSHQPEVEKSFIPPALSLPSHPRPTQKTKATRRHSSGSSGEAVSDSNSQSRSINHVTLTVCLDILFALNSLSKLDVSIVQALPPQMQALTLHVTERLLTCSLAKSPPISTVRSTRKSSQNSTPLANLESIHPSDQLQETVLAQTLIFVGFLCLLCPENQNFLSSGTPPCLLIRLCNLPIHYFTDEKLKQVVFPTLIALCYENDSNLNLLRMELNPILLSSFLQSLIDCKSENEELDRRLPLSVRLHGVEYFGK